MPQSREQVRPPHQRASLRQLEAAKKVTQTPWTRSVTPEVSPHISSAGIGQCPPPASKKRESVVALQERRLVTSGCGAFEPKADTPAQHGFRLLAAAEQLPGEGAAAHQPPAPRSPRPAAAAEQLPGEGAAAHQSPAPRSPRPAAAARRRGGRPRRRGGGRVPLRLLPELRGAAAGLAGLRLAGGKSRIVRANSPASAPELSRREAFRAREEEGQAFRSRAHSRARGLAPPLEARGTTIVCCSMACVPNASVDTQPCVGIANLV
ncbi:unnamed protein product [Prorocentrum cordatum]|uniref:Uncharacterized protein n=1 Tax=Prorocentrum cordatum TaxID=2364126 RepID=A0ABN9PF70_9DINO|nr:unnamed protein product [Polarella glacialis]